MEGSWGNVSGSKFLARSNSWSNLAHTWMINRAARFLAIVCDCHHLPARRLVTVATINHSQTHWLNTTKRELSLTFSFGSEIQEQLRRCSVVSNEVALWPWPELRSFYFFTQIWRWGWEDQQWEVRQGPVRGNHYLFRTLVSQLLNFWSLEVDHGGSVHTMEINKC